VEGLAGHACQEQPSPCEVSQAHLLWLDRAGRLACLSGAGTLVVAQKSSLALAE